jgi:proline racemase
MGGNEIILLYGDEVPVGREIEVALQALYPPHIRGHEAGLIYQGEEQNTLNVKIIGAISKGFISSCGGLTQVLGKALIETDLLQDFGLQTSKPMTTVILQTDAGPVKLKIEIEDRKVKRVLSEMPPFVEECYQLGVQDIDVAGVSATRIGKFLVADADSIRETYPETNFTYINKTTLQVLKSMQEAFDRQGYQDWPNADFAIYDLMPVTASHTGRVIFPHAISEDRIEPACGTGTLAVGISLIESGELEEPKESLQLAFESGGSPSSIGGPDLTRLQLTVRDGKVVEASFSHSLVQILATGQLWIR